MSYTVGIDTGVSGAWALLRTDVQPPKLVSVHDIPVRPAFVGRGQEVNDEELALQMRPLRLMGIQLVVIEWSWARSGQSIGAMFNFGVTHGISLSTVRASVPTDARVQRVIPVIWKSAMGLNADKQWSIQVASNMFPEHEQTFDKHDGRAEAALLAVYAHRLVEAQRMA